MEDEEQDEPRYLIKDEEKWFEIEKYKAEIEKYKTEKYIEVINNAIGAYKDYTVRSKRTITFGVFILITLIFFSMAILTYFNKVGGETFAFVTGTIIGYIISILKQGT